MYNRNITHQCHANPSANFPPVRERSKASNRLLPCSNQVCDGRRPHLQFECVRPTVAPHGTLHACKFFLPSTLYLAFFLALTVYSYTRQCYIGDMRSQMRNLLLAFMVDLYPHTHLFLYRSIRIDRSWDRTPYLGFAQQIPLVDDLLLPRPLVCAEHAWEKNPRGILR